MQLAEAELQVELGYLEAALALAAKLASRALDPLEQARAFRIRGQIAFYQGDAETSKRCLRQACETARSVRKVNPQLDAESQLVRWRLFSRVSDFGLGRSDFEQLKRAVLASGAPEHLIELRCCVAEKEAQCSSPHEALRHLEHAWRMLESYPNVWLEGVLHNHWSNTLSMLGDLPTAVEHARRAIAATDSSGHFRIRVAAQINLAQLLLSQGQTVEAASLLGQANSQIGSHIHLRAAALDAMAKLHFAKHEIKSARVVLGQLLRLRRDGLRRITSRWDALSELATRAQLLYAEQRYARALDRCRHGANKARLSGDRYWEVKFRLLAAKVAARSGSTDEAVRQLRDLIGRGIEGPEILAELLLARAETARVSEQPLQANHLQARGVRISSGLGFQVGRQEVLAGTSQLVSFDSGVEGSSTLLELAGYPHVLAREAYALLDMSGAADALALVARGDAGGRVLAARGWQDGQALDAAGVAGDCLVVTCGMHRDETWEIVARLKPSLTDRCTGAAIRKLVDTAVTLDRYRREEKQRAALWPPDTLETDGGLWISEQMTELLSIARRIAPADVSVLLTGETGTGKEVMARAVHRASGRGAKPFIPFNCTAVPREMLESQLFGYRKGAFTGAHSAFDGVIRSAAGGTLFLDEIAEIGLDLQPKLLRFLETHEVHGLGEAAPMKADVRVIAATNADLEALVADGRFREDLFYRLNVVRLRLPPLRERREEIPPLIEHYLRTFAEQQKKGRLTLDDETLEYLVLYRWPGNVRQLVNEISRVVAYAEPDSTITPALLSPEVQASRRTVRVQPGEEPEIRLRLDQPLGDAVDAIERVMILRALERANGNYENAARLLGISRKGLFLKRRRWGMQRQAS
jgi:DNA-binding NtrC family response regulator/tetratricopeptide (TPR) repeat protein